jgi:hypothetical protein
MADDATTATTLIEMLCTCESKPLGLDFILTAGCLVHDRCACPALAGFKLDPEGPLLRARGVRAVTKPTDDTLSGCLWCESFVALLKAVGSLDELTRARLKRAYLDVKR